MKRRFLFGGLFLAFFQVFAQTTFTTNGSGTVWNNSANWTCGGCGLYPGQSSNTDVVVINNNIDLTTTLPFAVTSVTITDAKLTITGAITFSASSIVITSTSASASLQILNSGSGSPSVSVSGNVSITKNSNSPTTTTFIIQGSTGNISTSVVTIGGNLTYDYNNASSSTTETLPEIRVGSSSVSNDAPSLVVSGDVKMTYFYPNTTTNNSLWFVADSNGSVVMNNLTLLMKDGGTGTTSNYITTDGSGTATITVNGDATMDYQPATTGNTNCANYIQPGSNNSSYSGLITIKGNLIMKSNQNNGSSNNFAMATGNSTLEVIGNISFQKNTSSVENRVELRHKATLKLYGAITPDTDGSFNFNSNTYNGTTNNNTIHFLGSSAQNFPKNFSASGGSKYDNIVIDNSYAITHPFTIPNSTLNILGTLTLKNGLITSSSSKQLVFENTASCPNGGTATSFVTGPIKKLGSTSSNVDLVFPTGYDAGSSTYYWGPIQVSSITGADATTSLTAQYFHTAFSTLTTDGTINHVSKLEYWNLSSTGTTPTTNATFYWEDARNSVIGNVQTGGSQDLYVARFNGTTWGKLTSSSIISPSYDSNTSPYTGSIMITSESTYGNFTFASITPPSTGNNVLPISLTDFEFELIKGGFVNLKWATETETDCDYFILTKSFDGRKFFAIDTIAGAGTTIVKHHYNSLDKFTLAGRNYYRLINVDFDGQQHVYDKTISVLVENAEQNYAVISPNPIRNSKATLHIRSFLPQDYHNALRVFDINGKDVTDKISFTQLMPTEYQFDSGSLVSGMYFIMLPNIHGGLKILVE